MSEQELPALTNGQKFWALTAAVLFLLSIAFLGFALNTGVMRTFAIGWVALQIFGYVGALSMAKGDFAHPLFKSQVMLHIIAVVLLVALVLKGSS